MCPLVLWLLSYYNLFLFISSYKQVEPWAQTLWTPQLGTYRTSKVSQSSSLPLNTPLCTLYFDWLAICFSWGVSSRQYLLAVLTRGTKIVLCGRVWGPAVAGDRKIYLRHAERYWFIHARPSLRLRWPTSLSSSNPSEHMCWRPAAPCYCLLFLK